MFITTFPFISKDIPYILSGKKTATARVWEAQRVYPQDLVIFTEEQHGRPFAVARITSIEPKLFHELDEADRNDALIPDQFKDFSELYLEHYGVTVKPDTKIFLVRFRLIDDGQTKQHLFDNEEEQELENEDTQKK